MQDIYIINSRSVTALDLSFWVRVEGFRLHYKVSISVLLSPQRFGVEYLGFGAVRTKDMIVIPLGAFNMPNSDFIDVMDRGL